MIGLGSTDIEELQVTLLRTLASVHRLRIVHLLGSGPCEVSELARLLGISQAATSQHLAALRSVGLVHPTRQGRVVHYQLSDPEIVRVCGLMRDVLVRRLAHLGDLAMAASHHATPSRELAETRRQAPACRS